jgi:hypothetical protein
LRPAIPGLSRCAGSGRPIGFIIDPPVLVASDSPCRRGFAFAASSGLGFLPGTGDATVSRPDVT